MSSFGYRVQNALSSDKVTGSNGGSVDFDVGLPIMHLAVYLYSILARLFILMKAFADNMRSEVSNMATTKETELVLWHALLDDDKAARYRPEFQTGALRKHAEVLHRFGLIDELELFELNELADARYAGAAEAFLDRLNDSQA
ncbi:hypothetical protein [Pseudomonas syringae]|uniref:hypothetical protein n=1 Tax=Pseudomonas syringae TaxID=317 RepID=UPI00200A8F57|nr:hypothetical protein [Pseudomonas syringae]MCK9709841.1 hypothetical protein [Pseudomonas syringae pv. syringae]